MAKYKVYYSGFSYVEADSEEEAVDCYDSDYVYDEHCVESVEVVDEFVFGL